jgi:hypothetical protein
MKTRVIKALILAFGLLGGFSSRAITLDLETHGALIEKLLDVKANLSEKDGSYVPTTLRIADLLADRARLLDIKSMEANQTLSPAAKNDRLQAIQLISSVESKIDSDQRSRALLQKAQLLQLISKLEEAKQILLSIRKNDKSKSDEFWSATDMLADQSFARGDFKTALALYSEIQKSPKANDYVAYRIAWCDLNLNNEAQAVSKMEAVLAKKNLDPGLRKEATRDISIFYARRPFTEANIDRIKNYSAGSIEETEGNLKLFSEELKRLGKKKESALVLLQYLKISNKGDESQVSRAELFETYVHIQKFNEANAVLQKIASQSCGDQCKDVQHKIHRTLRGWATEEGKKPSAELMTSFQIYSQVKPVDTSALLFGIKTAQDAEQSRAALSLLAILIKTTSDKEVLETALKAQIASAEKTKDASLKEMAYRAYLSSGRDAGLKKEIVGELIATMIENKKFDEAEAFALKNFSSPKTDKDLGEQILEIYRKSGQVEKERTFSYKMAAGDSSNEYFRNYKRLSLASTKAKMDQGKAGATELTLLMDLSNAKGSAKEQFQILNDAFLVALKIEDFKSLKEIADKMVLKSGSLGDLEKQLAFEKRMLVADLELDFAKSLYFDRKLSGKTQDPSKLFRLAVKARLSGSPDRKLESQILASGSFTQQQRVWVLENQMASGGNALNLLKANSWVGRNKETHSRLVLMAMAKAPLSQVKAYVARSSSLRGSLVDLLIRRRESIQQMKSFVATTLRQNIRFNSLNMFASSLETQIQGIKRFEGQFIARNGDSVGVMIAQGYFMLLNMKLSDQLEKAKTQLKVSAGQREAINAQIDIQINNLKGKISNSETQISSLWENSGVEKDFEQVLRLSHPLQRDAVVMEIEAWRDVSSGTLQSKWNRILQASRSMKSDLRDSSVESLYSSLRQNPFQSDKAKELAKREEARGNALISIYLNQRETKLKGGI